MNMLRRTNASIQTVLIAAMACWLALAASSVRAQSNIVYNGSFEPGYGEGALGFTAGWDSNAYVGGVKVFTQASDGVAWIEFSGSQDSRNGMLWQDLPTVPGRAYRIQFYFTGRASSNVLAIHLGDSVVGTVTNLGGWTHYTNLMGTATSNLTRLTFELLEGTAAMDGVFVGWNDEPPSIKIQPESRSAFESGTMGLTVTPGGATPLSYQWYFNQQALDGKTDRTMAITNSSSANSGSYFVVITNSVGSITSSVAQVSIQLVPKVPVITYQPRSQTLPEGFGVTLAVAAMGEAPLSYQWKFNGTNVVGETNSILIIPGFGQTNTGAYSVAVSNGHGSDESLPAVLTATNALGGGYIQPGNKINTFGYGSIYEPIYDVDGVTKLNANYVAQLYVGPDPASLLPLGGPMVFRSTPSSFAGCFFGYGVYVPNVGPNSTAYAQVRVWESAKGATYEQAQFSGGKFGKSEILSFVTPQIVMPPPPPSPLVGIKSFSVQAGVDYFLPAKIAMGKKLPNGNREWILTGEENSHYVMEKKNPPNDWVPLMVLFNESGTLTFVDPDQSNSSVKFYRARLLD